VNRNYSVLGVIPSGYDRAFKERAQERLVGWWESGAIRIPVEEPAPFDSLPEALTRLRSGEARGKLTLDVASNSD